MQANNKWLSKQQQPPDFYFFGKYFPSGQDGFTIMDIDGIVRWHGPNFKTDWLGFFLLHERKSGHIWKDKTLKDIPFHELIKLKIIHFALEERYRERYKGLYLVWSDRPGLGASDEFQINGINVSLQEIKDFYHAKLFHRFPKPNVKPL